MNLVLKGVFGDVRCGFVFCFVFAVVVVVVVFVEEWWFFEAAKMNDGRPMGVHYMDGGGFPYAVNENFVDFYQGHTQMPVNYAFSGSMPEQVLFCPLWFWLLGCNSHATHELEMCVVAGTYQIFILN